MTAKHRTSKTSKSMRSACRSRWALHGACCVVCALLSAGCAEQSNDAEESPPTIVEEAPAGVAIPQIQTTSSEIALRNLTSQISESERVLGMVPDHAALRAMLINLRLSRTQYLGTYADFDRADELTRQWLERDAGAPEAHTSRAAFLGAVHRFDEARRELEQVTALGGGAPSPQLSTIDIAIGRDLERALAERSELAERFPSFHSLADRAAAEAALGDFKQADASYLAALNAYRDVSPFPVAWVMFQRGMMWAEMAARPDLGEALYHAALQTLPDYVVANVHLAEIEAQHGKLDQARARLERIRTQTEDPEPSAVLAKLLLENEPKYAAVLAKDARRGYEALLARHPAAFRDHAAEFFANAGKDPARAVELSLTNLAERPTPRAYIVALNAAAAAGDTELGCRLVQQAQGLAARNRNLAEVLKEHAQCTGR